MRSLGRTLPGNLRRGPLMAFAFFAFAMLAAYEVAGYVLSNDVTSLAFVALAFAGGAIVIAMLNDWRRGTYFLLAWLLFEDLARKYLGNNMAIYFVKDFLAAVVYIAFFVAYRRRRDTGVQAIRPPFLTAVLLLVWFGMMQVFNPASTSLLYGLLGLKLYFYYIPLFFIGYALIDSETELRRFFQANLMLMLVIIALGLVQSVLGHTFLNPENPAEDIRLLSQTYREAPISGVSVYRPTSVFVSAGRFGNLLVVAWLIVFGFSGYLLLRHRRGRFLVFLTLGVTAAGCVMCASRGVFMWSIGSGLVGTAAFFWGAPWREGEVRRTLRTVVRAGLGVTLAMSLLLVFYPEPFMNRLAVYSETLDPRSPASELVHRTRDYPWANFMYAFDYPRWPYGYGIGTMSLGGQYVARIFGVLSPAIGVESGFGCLVLELGIVGLALWLVMSFAVVFCAWRVVRRLRGSPWFPLAFMIFWYAFLLLLPFTFMGMQAYQDFVLNAYLWLLLGILFRLPKLALSATAPPAAARVAAAAAPQAPQFAAGTH